VAKIENSTVQNNPIKQILNYIFKTEKQADTGFSVKNPKEYAETIATFIHSGHIESNAQ
jgi:hypothetical protein